MNKQSGPHRIEWTGWSWNFVGGCHHECRWRMADGTMAVCYAETTANKIAKKAYPEGFAHHYWRPHLLNEPLKVKTPAKIFVGSMADLFGHWVPAEQIQAGLDVCRQAHWHTFQFLTKNPVRLKEFDFPPNCWVGISSPPSEMNGHPLTPQQQDTLFGTSIKHLEACNAPTLWISFEPLSYNIFHRSYVVLEQFAMLKRFKWAVIGAASNGSTYYQPNKHHVQKLIWLLDAYGKAVFFKGNLHPSLGIAFDTWREEFPT